MRSDPKRPRGGRGIVGREFAPETCPNCPGRLVVAPGPVIVISRSRIASPAVTRNTRPSDGRLMPAIARAM